MDVLFADSPFLKSALDRAGALTDPEHDIDFRVVSCEDLILLKLQADRLLDRVDVIALLQLNRDALDLDYLHRWVRSLGLSREWGEAWGQSLPGQEPPATPSNADGH